MNENKYRDRFDKNLAKNIKKNIYGKAQIAKIIFPPGFGTLALEEAKAILGNLWFAKKFTGKLYLLKNEILYSGHDLLFTSHAAHASHLLDPLKKKQFKTTVV